MQICDFHPDPAAEKLVADYLEAVLRAARKCQPGYPHEDIEHLFVGALYRAAWTWRPGKAGFWHWWLVKAKGGLVGVRRRRARWAAGLKMGNSLAADESRRDRRGPPITLTSLSADRVDARFYYRA